MTAGTISFKGCRTRAEALDRALAWYDAWSAAREEENTQRLLRDHVNPEQAADFLEVAREAEQQARADYIAFISGVLDDADHG